jgi:hypothetical protein
VAFDDGDIACIADAVRPLLDGVSGLPMVLEPLGFFLTRDSPAFLGVVPTAPLLSLHHAICQAVGSVAGGLWPHYRTGTRLPHCTLAMHVADKAADIEVVSGFSTPTPRELAAPTSSRSPAADPVPAGPALERRRVPPRRRFATERVPDTAR